MGKGCDSANLVTAPTSLLYILLSWAASPSQPVIPQQSSSPISRQPAIKHYIGAVVR